MLKYCLLFDLGTVGISYGVRVKVGARTVVFATTVPIKVTGLEWDLLYITSLLGNFELIVSLGFDNLATAWGQPYARSRLRCRSGP